MLASSHLERVSDGCGVGGGGVAHSSTDGGDARPGARCQAKRARTKRLVPRRVRGVERFRHGGIRCSGSSTIACAVSKLGELKPKAGGIHRGQCPGPT